MEEVDPLDPGPKLFKGCNESYGTEQGIVKSKKSNVEKPHSKLWYNSCSSGHTRECSIIEICVTLTGVNFNFWHLGTASFQKSSSFKPCTQ